MNVKDMMSGNFFGGADLVTPRVLTIAGSEIKEFGQSDKLEKKVVLKFYEATESLSLNKTRLRALADAYGVETDGWVGKKVMIFGQKLMSGMYAGEWTIILIPQPTAPQPVVYQQQPATQQPAPQIAPLDFYQTANQVLPVPVAQEIL